MKRYWPTIAIVVTFAILLGYVIYIYKFKSTEQESPQVIFQTNDSKITSIALTSKGLTMELIRTEGQKTNGKYLIYIPEEVPAVQSKVQSIFKAASKIEYQEIISQDESNHTQYGFENPEAKFRINTLDGVTKTFQVGTKTPSEDSYYFKEEGRDIIYRVEAEVAEQFTQGINDIAEKNLIAGFDKNNVDRIVIDFDTQSKIFEKRNGTWWVDGRQMKIDKANQLMDQFRDSGVDGISDKDNYVSANALPLLKVVVYKGEVEVLSVVLINRDDDTFNAIKQGIGVQYLVTGETYQKLRDNLVRIFQEAIIP